MYFKLPPLPFDASRVAGWLSADTLEYHHGRHHRHYVDRLNALLKGSGMEQFPLEEVIIRAKGLLFENAAQAWNHTFYWLGIGADPKTQNVLNPLRGYPELQMAIRESFGTIERFEREFASAALGLFGSGWVWLVLNETTDKLEILPKMNAGNPIKDGLRPLLTCDVWEHAYYLDYRNSRTRYFEGFMRSVNWGFVERNLRLKYVCDLTKVMRAPHLLEVGALAAEKAGP